MRSRLNCISLQPGGQRRDLKEDSRHLYADIDPEVKNSKNTLEQ